MMILTRKLALGVAAVAAAGVLGTAGVAAATSQTSAPATAAFAAPSAGTGSAAPTTGTRSPSAGGPTKKHKAARRALARGMHGEWVVKGKDGKPVTLVSIRGQVTAVGPAGVTVKADDGFTATYATTSATKVRGGATKAADVKTGAKAAMVGVKSGNTTTARVILVRK